MGKFTDKLKEILLAIFTLLADAVVIYAIIWFAMNGIAWYWYLLLIGVTGPVLYVFNKYGLFETVKKWFKGKE